MENQEQLALLSDPETHLPEALSNDFVMEVNWGLALPVSYYKRGDSAQTDISAKRTVTVKTKTPDGLKVTTIATQSEQGPLGAYEIDVLLVLLTMTLEQEGMHASIDGEKKHVLYSIPELCKRLNLPYKHYATKIKESIQIIKSQTVFNHSFGVLDGGGMYDIEDEDGERLFTTEIIKTGTRGTKLKNFKKIFRGAWPSNIYRNLLNEYVSVLDSRDYLLLKRGAQRRVFIFLSTKRKKSHGDEFCFSLNDLAKLLGLENSTKRRRQISGFLDGIQSTTNSIEFKIGPKKDDDWIVWVKFIENKKLIGSSEAHMGEFFQALEKYYGNGVLKKYNLDERIFSLWKREMLPPYRKITGKDTFILHTEDDQEICVVSLALDCALWQGEKCGYSITSLKGLTNEIITNNLATENIKFPDGYGDFVFGRLIAREEEEVKEKIRKGKIKIDEEKAREQQSMENIEAEVWDNFSNDLDNLKELALRANERGLLEISEKQKEKLLNCISINDFYNLDITLLQNGVRAQFKNDFLSGQWLRSSRVMDKQKTEGSVVNKNQHKSLAFQT